MTRLIGVDLGGTNTDLTVLDTAAGRLVTAKVPTSSGDGVRLKTPGSGGYGNPTERDPDLRRADGLNGAVRDF